MLEGQQRQGEDRHELLAVALRLGLLLRLAGGALRRRQEGLRGRVLLAPRRGREAPPEPAGLAHGRDPRHGPGGKVSLICGWVPWGPEVTVETYLHYY